jgi:hypothetical protein
MVARRTVERCYDSSGHGAHLRRLTCPVTGARRPTYAHGGTSARVRVDREVRRHSW